MRSEGVKTMDKKTELIELLYTISVVAERLANNMTIMEEKKA